VTGATFLKGGFTVTAAGVTGVPPGILPVVGPGDAGALGTLPSGAVAVLATTPPSPASVGRLSPPVDPEPPAAAIAADSPGLEVGPVNSFPTPTDRIESPAVSLSAVVPGPGAITAEATSCAGVMLGDGASTGNSFRSR
jgi:hypothetical protein